MATKVRTARSLYRKLWRLTSPQPAVLPDALRHMESHITTQLAAHRARVDAARPPPLIVGVQGPQGSGKTYLTTQLRDVLQTQPHNLSVAVLSLDDLYLPHSGLAALATAHPDNALLRGRGQPGTHDIPLGTEILAKLKSINAPDTDTSEIELPSFDKSQFGGEGDRAPHGTVVRAPIDVVLFEGWCVGFYPIPRDDVERRWATPVPELGDTFLRERGFRIEDVLDVNERLQAYVEWWDAFDAFVQIAPSDGHPYSYIYKWRLQQEHHMMSKNGGRGMSDEQVKA